MADRLTLSLVVSNGALVIAVVALVAAFFVPGPSPAERGPPRVVLDANRFPIAGVENWNVTVLQVEEKIALWRFSVLLYMNGNNLLMLTPQMLVETDNLWVSGDGIYLNFTDADRDRTLSVGDYFRLENLYSSTMFSLRLLWAETGSQIQHATFRTP